MMHLLKIFAGLICCLPSNAQVSHLAVESAYVRDGAYSSGFTDAFSFLSNSASLGGINKFSVGVLTERKWMLEELDNDEIAVCGSLANGGFGVAFQRSGDNDYHEQNLEFAYGKHLGQVETGVNFGYLNSKAAGYPATDFVSTSIGIRFHLSPHLITGWEIGTQLFQMGLGYETDPLYMSCQIVKQSGKPVNIIPCISYHYSQSFFFSFGMNSEEGTPYFKSGWKKNRMSIQLYAVYHPVLGFTPGIVFLWDSKNPEK